MIDNRKIERILKKVASNKTLKNEERMMLAEYELANDNLLSAAKILDELLSSEDVDLNKVNFSKIRIYAEIIGSDRLVEEVESTKKNAGKPSLDEKEMEEFFSYLYNEWRNGSKFAEKVLRIKDAEKAKGLLKKAHNGDVSVFFDIACDYNSKNKIFSTNYTWAALWYSKSGDDPGSLNNLAVLYSDGKGVAKDELKAFELHKKAVNKVCELNLKRPIIYKNLAHCYQNGQGTQIDHNEALRLYTISAQHGNTDAKKTVTDYYMLKHPSIDIDIDAAIFWLDEIENEKSSDAYKKLIEYYISNTQKESCNFSKARIYAEIYSDDKTLFDKIEDVKKKADKPSFDEKEMEEFFSYLYNEWRNGSKFAEKVLRIKDTEKAKELFKKATEENADVQHKIGDLYFEKTRDDSIIEHNYSWAFFWYNKASKNNNIESIKKLSECFRHGYGTTVNREQTIELLKKIANAGDTLACRDLARYYSDTIEETIHWYEMSRKFGNIGINIELWRLYSEGKEPPANYEKALSYLDEFPPEHKHIFCYRAEHWAFKLPEERRNYSKARIYAEISGDRGLFNTQVIDSLKKNTEKPPLDEEEVLAFFIQLYTDWQNGSELAKATLCIIDEEKARELLEKAYNEDSSVFFSIAHDYESENEIFSKNYTWAAFWYTRVNNSCAAYHNLGNLYRYGAGVAKDMKKAFELYSKSVAIAQKKKQNISIGFRNLADMYKNGWGTDKNYEKAIELYAKAAEAGDERAIKHLTEFYMGKWGNTDIDVKKAVEWLEKQVSDNTHDIREKLIEYLVILENYECALKYYDELIEAGHNCTLNSETQHKLLSCCIDELINKINGDISDHIDRKKEPDGDFYEELVLPEVFKCFQNDEAKELFYDKGLYYEYEASEKDIQKAVICYYFAAVLGSKKSMHTITNMNANGSYYFIELEDFVQEIDNYGGDKDAQH